MSDDAKLNGSEESKNYPETEVSGKSADELQAMNSKLYNEVKQLRAEAKDRRLKLEEYEKADQKRQEEELSYKDRYEKKAKEFEDLKSATHQKELKHQFVSKVTEAGVPSKIANAISPKDLSEDNMDDLIKNTVKEFKEFIPNSDKKEEKPINPFASVQPKTEPSPKKVDGSMGNVWKEMDNLR